ncbi:MAG: NAD(P)-binding domain-containing protein [Pirellulaceae bacterium]
MLRKKRRIEESNGIAVGFGQVAKALAFGLLSKGASVIVAARNPAKVASLEKMGCRRIDWDARHTVNADIIVNGTPIGMHPNVDETPYEKHRLRPSMVIFDAVYNPEQTLLIKQAREKHCKVVTGVDMFVRQAAMQFRLFTGQDAPTELMRQVVKKCIGPFGF